MKKIFLLACILVLFVSCKKTTTYQIVNNSSFDTSQEYLDGSLYEVRVFEYIGDDIVKQDNISKISYGGGISKEIEVENDVQKVKVSFRMVPPESTYYESFSRVYVVAYSYLKEGENTIITIDNNTMVSHSISTTKDAVPIYILNKQ